MSSHESPDCFTKESPISFTISLVSYFVLIRALKNDVDFQKFPEIPQGSIWHPNGNFRTSEVYICARQAKEVSSEGDLFFFFSQRCCSFERRLPSYMCFFCKYAGRESSRCQDAACQVSISKSVAVRHVTARQTGIVKRKPFDPVRKTIPDASSAFDWTARVLRHAAHTQPLRQYRVAHGSH